MRRPALRTWRCGDSAPPRSPRPSPSGRGCAPFSGVLAAGVLVLVLAAARMPSAVAPGDRRRLDVPGGLLLGGAVALGLLAVTLGTEHRHPPVPPLLVAAGAVVALALLAARLRTAPEPLFPPRLLAEPAFTGAACVGLLAQGVNVALSTSVPLLLAQAGGLGAGALAGVLAPGPLTAAVVSPLSGRLADRVGAHWPVGAGLVAALVVLVAAVVLFGDPTGRHGPRARDHDAGPATAPPPRASTGGPVDRRPPPPWSPDGRPVHRQPGRRGVVHPTDGRAPPGRERLRPSRPGPRDP